ncbi:hypothetical protein EG329_003574 [Mollisiaceae sp. DMI_Dod_QoI]|nr:hypothetical protein EG329_003574 [Helotiales sp. DMI_Dod_QoI]
MKYYCVLAALAICLFVGVVGDSSSAGTTVTDLSIGSVITPSVKTVRSAVLSSVNSSVAPSVVASASASSSTSAALPVLESTSLSTRIMSACDVVYPTYPVYPWMVGNEITCSVTTITYTSVSTSVSSVTLSTTATITQPPSTKTMIVSTPTINTVTALCQLGDGIAAPCTTVVNSPAHTSDGPVNANPFLWIVKVIQGVGDWFRKIFKISDGHAL